MVKKQSSIKHLPAASVVLKVVNQFNKNRKTDDYFQLLGAPSVIEKPWSTLYFFSLSKNEIKKDITAKIVRFPNQGSADISWKMDELISYSLLEYKTLVLVHDHFRGKEKDNLYTVTPLGHIPENSILVMAYLKGQPLKTILGKYSIVLNLFGDQKSHLLLKRAGQWLRHFHILAIPAELNIPTFSFKDTYNDLLEKSNKLIELGINLTQLKDWQQALSKIVGFPQGKRICAHGDFHPGNLMVLPDLSIAGIDIALERVDSVYYDIGRFIGEFKTRRISLLSLGRIPTQYRVKKDCESFLDGYFRDEVYDRYKILLFEGDLYLEKWLDTIEKLQEMPFAKFDWIEKAIRKFILSPIYFNIMRKWIADLMSDEIR